ncbi:TetR/AcrR family transcriptional regulator [Caenimonas sedimenti]|uniref:TetR/AcrR family transcriptional regulator n=1 Tax=Caenimonas sedimenti TaxID=2596921 RepID=A0A562ZIQ5_9BURK|nr:TetR/AcrR family transcriptional regulator [Caenimonas sedimenti]TWO68470.1 TetR/AcrR family transcriptional regulator [Caenimonas sedimenti]
MQTATAPAGTASTTRPPRRKQAERVAESDRRMIDAAMRLIASGGYSQTTLANIGVEAGYSRGLVQHRFGSKDKLLEALINQVANDHRERLLPKLRGLAGIEALECEIDSYLEGVDQPSVSSRAFFVLMLESIGPAPHVRQVFAEISKRWHDALAGQIRKGQKAGEIRKDVDAAMEAQLLIAAVRGLRMQSMLSPETSRIALPLAALKRDLRRRLLAPPR